MYIAAQTGEELSQADIGNAFVEAELDDDEIIFVEQHADAAVAGFPASEYV